MTPPIDLKVSARSFHTVWRVMVSAPHPRPLPRSDRSPLRAQPPPSRDSQVQNVSTRRPQSCFVLAASTSAGGFLRSVSSDSLDGNRSDHDGQVARTLVLRIQTRRSAIHGRVWRSVWPEISIGRRVIVRQSHISTRMRLLADSRAAATGSAAIRSLGSPADAGQRRGFRLLGPFGPGSPLAQNA